MVHCLEDSSQSISIFMPVLPAFVSTAHRGPVSICPMACAWRVYILLIGEGTSLVAQLVKNLPAVQEAPV